MHSRPGPDVIVLGAGIQGVCTALALARRGLRVTVIEAAEDCMLRASGRNEGKIHLGFVYANDPSGRTSDLMLEAALRFGDLVDGWCERALPWSAMRSRPFTYLILEDSMLDSSKILDAYTRLQSVRAGFGDARYLGAELPQIFSPEARHHPAGPFSGERVACAIETNEVALDVGRFRAEIRASLHDHPLVEMRYSRTVRDASRTSAGFDVSGSGADGAVWRLAAPVVVNCLWDQRIALDMQLGIVPERAWVHRLKYRVLGRLPIGLTDLPSLTLVLGRFGDIVVYPEAATYLSWYPACLAGWDVTAAPPLEWVAACRGDDQRPSAHAVARDTVAGLADIVPQLEGFRTEEIGAGIITAWGSTDIDDPSSDLHGRSEIGVQAHDGWFSINTGKFTTAPLFAAQLARAVEG